MKGFLRIFGILLLIPYVGIAIIITVFLLNYNEYGVTEIGDKTFVVVDGDELIPTYKKGDLLVITRASNSDINVYDNIFFYQKNKEKKTVVINLGRVVSKYDVNDSETTFTLDGNVDYSSEYVIGTTDDTKVYNSLGSVVSFLESRLVFLLFIIIPLLFIFLYELYEFVIEVKKNLKEA